MKELINQLQVEYNNYKAELQAVGLSGTFRAKIEQNSVFLKVGIIPSIKPTISLQELSIQSVG
jgi:hypothetical protein